jgi:hypothetical protein
MRECIPFLLASLFVIGVVISRASQDAPTSSQKNYRPPALPTVTTDDGKFTLTVRECDRVYDAVDPKKSLVKCTVLIESKIDGALKISFAGSPPLVLLTDDTGKQCLLNFRGEDSQAYILPLDPHLPVSRDWMFTGASEDSTSASLVVGFVYGSAAVFGYNGAAEHVVIRNIPLHIR